MAGQHLVSSGATASEWTIASWDRQLVEVSGDLTGATVTMQKRAADTTTAISLGPELTFDATGNDSGAFAALMDLPAGQLYRIDRAGGAGAVVVTVSD